MRGLRLAGITLAGLPPTSGFIAKVSVFAAGTKAGAWVPLAALVIASLFTLASMLKIWQHAFQGKGNTTPSASQGGRYGWAPLAGSDCVARFRKLIAAAHVTWLFAWELTLSNFQQLRVVLGPARLVQPHWLSFQTELASPALRALLGTLISLPPEP
ncbi:MAG: Na+/H+ antiporter subunit E [Myxococcota bacterium]